MTTVYLCEPLYARLMRCVDLGLVDARVRVVLVGRLCDVSGHCLLLVDDEHSERVEHELSRWNTGRRQSNHAGIANTDVNHTRTTTTPPQHRSSELLTACFQPSAVQDAVT